MLNQIKEVWLEQKPTKQVALQEQGWRHLSYSHQNDCYHISLHFQDLTGKAVLTIICISQSISKCLMRIRLHEWEITIATESFSFLTKCSYLAVFKGVGHRDGWSRQLALLPYEGKAYS